MAIALATLAGGCLADRISTADLRTAAGAAAQSGDASAADAPQDGDFGVDTAGDAAAATPTVADSADLGDLAEDGGKVADSSAVAGDAGGADASQLDEIGTPADAGDGLTSGCKTALDCDDFVGCTVDSCDASTGACAHVADDGACASGNPCLSDFCDPANDCQQALANGPCDDGNPCTSGDTCAAGECKPGPNGCGCQTDGECSAKDDGNSCNGTLVCDKTAQPHTCVVKAGSVVACPAKPSGACAKEECVPATGQCAPSALANGTACDDGSKCTVGDVCQAGKCAAGSAALCDDGNACTVEACDPGSGCVTKAAANGTACPGGQCAAGLCAATPQGKSWPYGKDGDLLIAATQELILDADSREPPIWDFATCQISGKLRIIGNKPWVLIGCASDTAVDGSIEVTASYDSAQYKDSQQPAADGKLSGPPLARLPFAQPAGGGGSTTGNGIGGAAGGTCAYCDTKSACNPGVSTQPGKAATDAAGGEGGGSAFAGVVGAGGTAKNKNGSDGTLYKSAVLGDCQHNGGGGGGFRGANTANLFVHVAGKLVGSGTIALSGAAGGAGGNGAPGGECYSKCGYNGNNSYIIKTANAQGGSGGAGGAGGKLVVRAAGSAPWLTAGTVLAAGGSGGAGGKGGTNAKYATAAGLAGAPGAAGGSDFAYLASGGSLGSACSAGSGGSGPCQAGLNCAAISSANLCTKEGCTSNAECLTASGVPGVCLAVGPAKACVLPCDATTGCDRADFVCDLAKGGCVPK